MIVEVMIAGITAIFLGSLVFANTQIKRQRQWDKEDNSPPLKIYPFLHILVGTPCPKCLREAKNEVVKKEGAYNWIAANAEGPSMPKACNDSKCLAKGLPHLHASCYTCKYSWFMRPADEKKLEGEGKDDHRQPRPSRA